jgi:Fe-S oxidoreductase
MEEAVKTGAKPLAVACPFCITMLEDAANGPNGGPEVRDIAEIIA